MKPLHFDISASGAASNRQILTICDGPEEWVYADIMPDGVDITTTMTVSAHNMALRARHQQTQLYMNRRNKIRECQNSYELPGYEYQIVFDVCLDASFPDGFNYQEDTTASILRATCFDIRAGLVDSFYQRALRAHTAHSRKEKTA